MSFENLYSPPKKKQKLSGYAHGGNLFKKAQSFVASNQDGMKLARIVPVVNTHRLTESDFGYNVMLSIWRPYDVISCRKVLPPGE